MSEPDLDAIANCESMNNEASENITIANISQSKSVDGKNIIESQDTLINTNDTSPSSPYTKTKMSLAFQSSGSNSTPVMQMIQGQSSVIHDGQQYTVTSQGLIAIPQQGFSQPINVMRSNQGHLQLIGQQPYISPYYNQPTIMLTSLGGQNFNFQPRENCEQNSTIEQKLVCSVTSSSMISPAKNVTLINSSSDTTTTITTSSKPSVATVTPQIKQSMLQSASQKSVVIVPASYTNQPILINNKIPQQFGQLVRLSNGQQVILTPTGVSGNQSFFQNLPIQQNTQFVTGNPAGLFIRTATPIQQVKATKKKEHTTVLPKIISRKPECSLNNNNRAKPKVLSKATTAQRNAAIIAGVVQQSTALQSTETPLITAETTLSSTDIVTDSQMTSSVINDSKKSQDQNLKSNVFTNKPQNAVSPLKIVERKTSFERDSSTNETINSVSSLKSPELKVPPTIATKNEPFIRPDVLIHVIDGMVLCESKEPLDNSFDMVGLTNRDINSSEKDDIFSSNSSIRISEKIDECSTSDDFPILNKCETCGKQEKEIKFKRSGRFCSLSCAKRFNVLCSKRIPGNLDSDKSKNDSENIKESKKKSYLKRKFRRSQNRGRLSGSPLKRESNKGMFSSSDDSDNEPLNIRKFSTKALNTIIISSSENEIKLPCSSKSSTPITSLNELSPKTLETAKPPQPTNHPTHWTVNDVYAFVKNVDGCEVHAETFKQEQIDGQALMLLKHEHLMSTIGMKLGPALKISDLIKKICNEKKD